MRVEHRYIKQGWYTPKDATSLLIGTFPSILIREKFNRVRPTDVDFFYGSIDNHFWRDLAFIYDKNFTYNRSQEAIEQRMALLDSLQLALSDVILSCETSGSAQDTALQEITLNTGIIQTLDEHPTIKRLYFTSSSGKINAESLTLRILREGNRLSKMKITQSSGPRQRKFLFQNSKGESREMETITLISPSPLAEQWGNVTTEKRRLQYKTYLPKIKGE